MANLQLTSSSISSFNISGGITASNSPWIAFSGSSFGTFGYQQFPNFLTGYFGYYSTTSWTPCYAKHQNIVKVQGLISTYPNSDSTYGGTGSRLNYTPGSMSEEIVYTLPTGYRPGRTLMFPAMTGPSMQWPHDQGSTSADGPENLIVDTSGNIRWFGSGNQNREWIALDFEFIAA